MGCKVVSGLGLELAMIISTLSRGDCRGAIVAGTNGWPHQVILRMTQPKMSEVVRKPAEAVRICAMVLQSTSHS